LKILQNKAIRWT